MSRFRFPVAALAVAAGLVLPQAAAAGPKPLSVHHEVRVGHNQFLAADVSLNRDTGVVTGLFEENNGNTWQGYTAACIVLFHGQHGELLDLRVTRGYGIDGSFHMGTRHRFIPLRWTLPRDAAKKVTRIRVITSKTGRGFDNTVKHLTELAKKAKEAGE